MERPARSQGSDATANLVFLSYVDKLLNQTRDFFLVRGTKFRKTATSFQLSP
jgi:hypothetical protein